MQEAVLAYLQTYDLFKMLVFFVPLSFFLVGFGTWLYYNLSGWYHWGELSRCEYNNRADKQHKHNIAVVIRGFYRFCFVGVVATIAILYILAGCFCQVQSSVVAKSIKDDYGLELKSEDSTLQKAMLHSGKDCDSHKLIVKSNERFYDVYLIEDDGEYNLYTRNEKGAYLEITPAAVRELQNQ